MESPEKQKLTIAELPYLIEDFQLIKKLESREQLSNVLSMIGIGIAVVGGLILIFGPSSVMVSRSGPTFFEMLLLVPGPTISVGVLLLFISSQIAHPVLNEIEAFITQNFELIDSDGLPSNRGIIRGKIEQEGHLRLVFVPASELTG